MAKTHDGSDFKHRQRILPHYQTMALSKKRLKFIVILHLLLTFLMAVKLLPTVLDLFDIFWQPLEELYIPMAKPWEWIWFASFLQAFVAFKAIKTNNASQLKSFIFGTFVCSIMPLLYCAYLYSADFRTFVITRDAENTSETWRNYPVALFWYIFIGVACQVHGFELYFSWELLRSLGGQRGASKNK